MAGYVRQSTAEILPSLVILADSFNKEFNALQTAFNNTAGHTHDGTTGNGPKVNLTTSVSGILPVANGGTGTVGDSLTLTSTDAGASLGPAIDLYRNSASPAINDTIGYIGFTGNDSGGNKTDYAYVYATIIDPTNGSEDGTLTFVNVVAGTPTQQGQITSTGWNGMNIGASTAGTGRFSTLTATGAFSLSGDQVQISEGGTGATTAATARTALGVAIGSDVQAYDATLAALAAFNTTGILVQTAADTFAGRTLSAPAAGLTITNPAGTAGNPTFALANDLSALEGLASTGIAVRTTTDTWAQRTVTGTAAEITVTNGDGVSGNPTLSLPSAMTMTGKTLTGGTYASAALNGTLGATTPSTVAATTGAFSGQVTGPAGSTGAPSYSFTGDTDTGIYHIASGFVGIVADAVLGFQVGSAACRAYKPVQYAGGSAGAPSMTFDADSDTGIYSVGANQLGIAAGGSLVGTFTSTGINSTAIGATTPSTGAFTTVAASSQVEVGTMSTSGASNGIKATTTNLSISTTAAVSATLVNFYGTSGGLGNIAINNLAGTTAYNTASDEDLKIFNGNYSYDDARNIILADPVRHFNWIEQRGGTAAIGWGAQTSYKVASEFATPGHGKPGDEDYQPWSIDKGARTPYLWAAVAGLIEKIEALEAKIERLQNGQS